MEFINSIMDFFDFGTSFDYVRFFPKISYFFKNLI